MKKICFILFLLVYLPLNVFAVTGEINANLSSTQTLYEENYNQLNLSQFLSLKYSDFTIDIQNNAFFKNNNDESPGINPAIFFNKKFNLLNSQIYLEYNQQPDDNLDFSVAGFKMFYNKKKSKYLYETGIDFNSFNYFSNKDFSYFSTSLYLIYKHFFKSAALNIETDLGLRKFHHNPDFAGYLTRFSGDSYLSLPITNSIGLKTGAFFNYNLTKSDSVIYNDVDLYDLFSYNQFDIYTSLTIYLRQLMLQPQLTFSTKHYREIAESKPYNESSVILGLYSDYPLSKNLLIFIDSFYQRAINEYSSKIAYRFSVGCRFKF